MDTTLSTRSHHREPWNKGKLIGQKAPFKPKDIWAMCVRLQQHIARANWRYSISASIARCAAARLRGCDRVSLKVRDIPHGDRVASRAIVQQKKTGRPVQFEITAPAREAVDAWIREAQLRTGVDCALYGHRGPDDALEISEQVEI